MLVKSTDGVISTSAIMNRFMLSDLCFKLLDLIGKDIEQ